MSAYGVLPSQLQDGVNPVEWRVIVVSGDNENVSLTPVSREEATAMDAGGGMSGAASRDLLLSITSQLRDTNAHVEELWLQYERDRNQGHAAVERQYRVHNENIRRMAIAPARCVIGGTAGSGRSIGAAAATMVANHLGDPKAMLSANPRSLILVWEEWTHGLNGNKPASQFTSQQRGQNKHKFCWRKVFWDLVSNLVQAGVDSNVAINRVYAVY
jgi:Transcriptional activator of glycolytic enzymes